MNIKKLTPTLLFLLPVTEAGNALESNDFHQDTLLHQVSISNNLNHAKSQGFEQATLYNFIAQVERDSGVQNTASEINITFELPSPQQVNDTFAVLETGLQDGFQTFMKEFDKKGIGIFFDGSTNHIIRSTHSAQIAEAGFADDLTNGAKEHMGSILLTVLLFGFIIRRLNKFGDRGQQKIGEVTSHAINYTYILGAIVICATALPRVAKSVNDFFYERGIPEVISKKWSGETGVYFVIRVIIIGFLGKAPLLGKVIAFPNKVPFLGAIVKLFLIYILASRTDTKVNIRNPFIYADSGIEVGSGEIGNGIKDLINDIPGVPNSGGEGEIISTVIGGDDPNKNKAVIQLKDLLKGKGINGTMEMESFGYTSEINRLIRILKDSYDKSRSGNVVIATNKGEVRNRTNGSYIEALDGGFEGLMLDITPSDVSKSYYIIPKQFSSSGESRLFSLKSYNNEGEIYSKPIHATIYFHIYIKDGIPEVIYYAKRIGGNPSERNLNQDQLKAYGLNDGIAKELLLTTLVSVYNGQE